MLGTFANVAAIIAGGLIGTLLKGGLSSKISDAVIKGLALCVLLVGVLNALKVSNLLLVIIAMVLGAIVGEWLDIDQKLKAFGDGLAAKLKGRGGKVSEGFVTGSLLYCVGAMAIVGSPAYFARIPKPIHPRDLRAHNASPGQDADPDHDDARRPLRPLLDRPAERELHR